jgi:hypothetical protein
MRALTAMADATRILADEHWRRFGWSVLEYPSNQRLDELAAAFGRLVSVRPGGPTVDRLVPLSRSQARPRSLSKVHGRSEFPFHTDAAHHKVPPRLLLIRLADGARTQVPTQLVDALGATSLIASALRAGVWLIRPGRQAFYAGVLSTTPGACRFRYDAGCMIPRTEAASAVEPVLREQLNGAPCTTLQWSPGEVVAVDNWRMAHRRGRVDMPSEDGRVLERSLVDVEADQ